MPNLMRGLFEHHISENLDRLVITFHIIEIKIFTTEKMFSPAESENSVENKHILLDVLFGVLFVFLFIHAAYSDELCQ